VSSFFGPDGIPSRPCVSIFIAFLLALRWQSGGSIERFQNSLKSPKQTHPKGYFLRKDPAF
jgi:hypothetical protein